MKQCHTSVQKSLPHTYKQVRVLVFVALPGYDTYGTCNESQNYINSEHGFLIYEVYLKGPKPKSRFWDLFDNLAFSVH